MCSISVFTDESKFCQHIFLFWYYWTACGHSQASAQAHFTGILGSYDVSHMMTPSRFPSQQFPSTVPSYNTSTGSHFATLINPSIAPQSYLDSGAAHHVTNNLQNLQIAQPTAQNDGILVGNGSQLQVTHTGKGLLPTPLDFCLSHILYSPQITHNLLSVFQFAKDNNCLLTFDSDGLVIQDKKTHQILYQGPCVKGLYPIQTSSKASPCGASPIALVSPSFSLAML